MSHMVIHRSMNWGQQQIIYFLPTETLSDDDLNLLRHHDGIEKDRYMKLLECLSMYIVSANDTSEVIEFDSVTRVLFI